MPVCDLSIKCDERMKVGDLVLIKECRPDALYNEVMYSDRHGDYKGIETKVLAVSWRKNDKIKLECAPDLLFGKDMLVPTKNAEKEYTPTDWHRGGWGPATVIYTAAVTSMPKQIIEEMKERHKKFDGKLGDKETYRELFRDKLETVLVIKSWWKNQ